MRMAVLSSVLMLTSRGCLVAGAARGGALVAPGPSAQVSNGLGWLAQHMQWDFDDIDPNLPLSPFWRFDHRVRAPILPAGHDSIRLSTTVRPTGRRGWVTTTVNPFDWLQMQGTVMSQGLMTPVAAASTEVVLPLGAVTQRADRMINGCLGDLQEHTVGRTVAGGLDSRVLVGVGTREEPWIGVETDARVSLSEKGRPLRLRARVTMNRDYQVPVLDTMKSLITAFACILLKASKLPVLRY
jgi:hypothetical protein